VQVKFFCGFAGVSRLGLEERLIEEGNLAAVVRFLLTGGVGNKCLVACVRFPGHWGLVYTQNLNFS
jgi:hypothetical protein